MATTDNVISAKPCITAKGRICANTDTLWHCAQTAGRSPDIRLDGI